MKFASFGEWIKSPDVREARIPDLHVTEKIRLYNRQLADDKWRLGRYLRHQSQRHNKKIAVDHSSRAVISED